MFFVFPFAIVEFHEQPAGGAWACQAGLGAMAPQWPPCACACRWCGFRRAHAGGIAPALAAPRTGVVVAAALWRAPLISMRSAMQATSVCPKPFYNFPCCVFGNLLCALICAIAIRACPLMIAMRHKTVLYENKYAMI